jgi:hypothetical protein
MPGPSTSTFLTTTTTTMTQTTPPTTVTAPAATPATSVSRSSSAPATPGLTGAAQGAHPSSHFSVRKTSLPYYQTNLQQPASSFQVVPSTDHMPRTAASSSVYIKHEDIKPPLQYISTSIPNDFATSTVPTMVPATTTPTETTVGYTPAALTVATDPFTVGSVTSSATPRTVFTTPSPPMHHVLPLEELDEEYYLRHYATHLIKPGMAPMLESELFHTINEFILRHYRTTTHLHHVVLAFSALQIASRTPSPSPTHSHHLATALYYKNLALENFRPALAAGVTPENGESLLATSIVLVACIFALPVADPMCKTGYNHIDILAETMGLFQGTSAIIKQGGFGDMASSHQRICLGTNSLQSSTAEAPLTEWERSMSMLQDTIETVSPSSAEEEHRKSVLLHAAEKLRRCVAQEMITCLWLGMVKRDVAGLVSKRDPLAMALVAHWAILSRDAPRVWWKARWIEAYMAAVQEVIGDEHHHLISWCLAQLE